MTGSKSSEDAIRVECYAGHRGEQTPRRFTVGERRVEVVDVVDAWLAPDHRYFKVTGDDGLTYLLRHDLDEQTWHLAAGHRPPSAVRPSRI